MLIKEDKNKIKNIALAMQLVLLMSKKEEKEPLKIEVNYEGTTFLGLAKWLNPKLNRIIKL